MTRVGLVLVLTIAASGLAACGGDDGAEVRTVTVPPADTAAQQPPNPAAMNTTPILIQTTVINARHHKAVVRGGSFIGESAFCPGAKATGGSEGPTITTTFRCRGGTLKVQYAPTQHSLVQGSVWEVVSATGSFEGVRGGGSMVARFERDDPDAGGEIFTGTVGK